MPMPKKFEDWTPPWKAKGEEFDADTAAKLVFNLETDKEKLGEQKAAVAQERDAAATARDTLQAAIDAKAREGESAEAKAQRLEQELVALRAQPAPGQLTPEVQQARLMAALSIDGITAKDALTLAQFIQGTTKEEAETSAKSFVETFGIPGATKSVVKAETDDDDDDEPDDVGSILRQQPRSGANNPLDPRDGSGGEKPVSDLLGQIPRL